MRSLPKGIWATFTFNCVVCGAECTVTDGKVDPHHCRIEAEE